MENDFPADLDRFLGKLPKGWSYAVEMRNAPWLRDEYFGCLARHGVAHVFNSWKAMPSVTEQMALPGSRTNQELITARFLLKPGRRYEEAVKTFEPYDKTQEVNKEARDAGAALIHEGTTAPKRKTLIYVNNRLEGNALATIEAMISGETDDHAIEDNRNEAKFVFSRRTARSRSSCRFWRCSIGEAPERQSGTAWRQR